MNISDKLGFIGHFESRVIERCSMEPRYILDAVLSNKTLYYRTEKNKYHHLIYSINDNKCFIVVICGVFN
jgi:hypothetical protein